MAQVPVYLQLVADHRVVVPTQVFPLSDVANAWDASTRSGNRVVIVPG
jgi:hypothetical protein